MSMEVYVVQPNDTIYTIAIKFNVPVRIIIRDNELNPPYTLITGQTIVIAYPQKIYITKSGDSLESIAKETNVSQMQLLRNNPYLSNRPVIPGDTLTISYNTTGNISTAGYIYPYINTEIYKKTLPFLTYITIYNYRTKGNGDIISYYDDTKIVQLAKEYGAIPLLMATTLSAQGDPDIESVYSLLLNDSYQLSFINNAIKIIKEKGYLGLNIIFNYLNPSSLDLHIKIIKNFKTFLDRENLLLFVTLNPNTRYINNEFSFEEINFSQISKMVDNITVLQFIWGINYGPPLPVNSISQLKSFISYLTKYASSDKIIVGNSLISYDWKLPYISGVSYANSLSLESSLRLAGEVGATIQFDEPSQSPFYNYIHNNIDEHIVWAVDARSINALVKLIIDNKLDGAGFWNLMLYTAQLWLVINTQLDIIKLIPSKFD